ncbi:MAG: hypothetical protein KDJ86_12835 [Bauldia sp.]|uniref:hypothetical protein n=1 Tax=Bauldia sp. TaxID=2575872 RepID=UPI001D5D60BE|nr:hypothetical protein [Bauldia sp.]MCB1496667.1 hypothetical protein [Bauldia sp.]
MRAPVLLLGFVLLLVGSGSALAASDCDDALAPGHAYETYRTVWRKLKKGAEPRSVEHLGCFLPDGTAGLDADGAYRLLITTAFDANVLYDYLEAQAEQVLRTTRNLGQRRGGQLAWNGGYVCEAALTAYQQTGDRRFLDLFVTYFNGVLDLRDSELGYGDEYHRRIMAAWGEYRELPWFWADPLRQGAWLAHITHTARITYPASKFAVIVKNDPALAAYKPDADRFIAATRTAIAEFDDDRFPIEGTDMDWYARPVTGGPEATNHIHTLGSVLVNLFLLDGDEDAAKRVRDILKIFEAGVTTEADDTVHWKYFPYFADQSIGNNGLEYSERIWKASQTVPLIYRAYAAGFDVPESLVRAITDTFLRYIVRDNEVIGNVSPTESEPIDEEDDNLSRLSGIVTWLEFSDYEPEIAVRIRELVGARPDLFPRGWFESPNSARGYAFFLGRD